MPELVFSKTQTQLEIQEKITKSDLIINVPKADFGKQMMATQVVDFFFRSRDSGYNSHCNNLIYRFNQVDIKSISVISLASNDAHCAQNSDS